MDRDPEMNASCQWKRAKKRSMPTVRPTAYSIFCKMYCEEHPGFNPVEWQAEWKNMSEGEKKEYADIAAKSTLVCNKKTIRGLLSQMEWTLQTSKSISLQSSQLNQLGLPNFCLIAESNTVHSIGKGKGREFLEKENIEPSFSRHCNKDTCEEQSENNTTKLRQQVQTHLNTLFRAATGKHCSFPYKKVRNGELIIEGFPDPLLPLFPPSHYGRAKLQMFLNCETISVRDFESVAAQSEGEQGLESVFQPVEPTTENGNEVQVEPFEAALIESEQGLESVFQPVEPTTENESEVQVEPFVQDLEKEMRKVVKRKPRKKGKKCDQLSSNDIDEGIYYVERLVSKRSRGRKMEYLVKWVGYQDPTWEPERNIPTHIIENFMLNSV